MVLEEVNTSTVHKGVTSAGGVGNKLKIRRIDHVGVIVNNLSAAKAFFS